MEKRQPGCLAGPAENAHDIIAPHLTLRLPRDDHQDHSCWHPLSDLEREWRVRRAASAGEQREVAFGPGGPGKECLQQAPAAQGLSLFLGHFGLKSLVLATAGPRPSTREPRSEPLAPCLEPCQYHSGPNYLILGKTEKNRN